MFYVKTRLNDDAVIEVDISSDNVFCRCPRCGTEVSIDLAQLASDEEFSFENCAVLCDKCSEEFVAEHKTTATRSDLSRFRENASVKQAPKERSTIREV